MSSMETNKRGPMTIAVSEILLINMEKPGVAFPFIKLYPDSEFPFHIALMTKNQAQKQRLRNHLNKLGLSQVSIHQDDYSSKPEPKVLYLSEDPGKAEEAIKTGHAAAIMFPNDMGNQWNEDRELCVAFDGDGVLFSDECEIVYVEEGMEAFKQNEKDKEDIAIEKGPLKCFLEALSDLQNKLPSESWSKVQTYLVTSRNPLISGTRALKTLTTWQVDISQAFFVSRAPKASLLATIRPHIFFDDKRTHIDKARELGVISAHVPYGKGYATEGACKK
ncbi:cytosolic 5'-nucleotidase 1A-like isoform X2 [Conger conger]|uniref:cytosolic 5'-nucleotidase 1A-like isoform X2 n=1 Tax=Conger conger TaxID=82655 RepID=UPI002A5A971D|nr:cytosolic 5'-nucleotidase 1A-like isoform X2 [Conger conger]